MRVFEIAALALQGLRRSPLRVTLTTLGVTFAAGMLVTMVALSLGVQRQVETPFRALSLLNNIEVSQGDRKGKEKPPPLTDDRLAEMEKLPGVVAAYPDAHVKNIHLSYGGKETTAIGLAMPSEVALLGISREILVAGRLFEEGDERETIIGMGVLTALGFSSPQDALGKEVTVDSADLAAADSKGSKADRAAESDRSRRLPGARGDGPQSAKRTLSAGRSNEAASRHVPGIGLEHRRGRRQPEVRRIRQRHGAGPRSQGSRRRREAH